MRLRIANVLRRLADRFDRQPDVLFEPDYPELFRIEWESSSPGLWLRPVEGD